MIFAGTFISGCEKVIKKLLSEIEYNAQIINIYDGFVIFETDNFININKIPFLNNIYLLIGNSKLVSSDFDKNIQSLIKNLKIDYKKINYAIKNITHRSFKIKAIYENQPTKIDYKKLATIENDISFNSKMILQERNPDIDFIILQRRNEKIYLLLKLSYDKVTEKELKQGSLRPELSYVLSAYADINKDDIVLDPFCGSGSIPKTIVKHFKYNMCFASDMNIDNIEELKKEYKGNNKHLYIKNENALNLKCFEDDFIDVIVTDPPWNIYNKDDSLNFKDFYLKMLKEMERILKKNSRAIILMGNVDDFLYAIEKSNFSIEDELSILVNGKKANVYKIIMR